MKCYWWIAFGTLEIRMALSRAHSSAKTADVAIFVNKGRVTHAGVTRVCKRVGYPARVTLFYLRAVILLSLPQAPPSRNRNRNPTITRT